MKAVFEVVVCPHLNALQSMEVREKTKTSPQGYCNTKARSSHPRTGKVLEPEIGEVVELEGLSCSGGGTSEDMSRCNPGGARVCEMRVSDFLCYIYREAGHIGKQAECVILCLYHDYRLRQKQGGEQRAGY